MEETWKLLQEYLDQTVKYDHPRLTDYTAIGSSVQITYTNDYDKSKSETLDILDYITFIYNKLNKNK